MLIYDETNLIDEFIESTSINTIYLHDTVCNGKEWRISFTFDKGSTYWLYSSQHESKSAMKRLRKFLKVQSINSLSL